MRFHLKKFKSYISIRKSGHFQIRLFQLRNLSDKFQFITENKNVSPSLDLTKMITNLMNLGIE